VSLADNARRRVLQLHTSVERARELEEYVTEVSTVGRSQSLVSRFETAGPEPAVQRPA